MPDLKPSIIGLLEYWGLLAATVTLLLKSLQAILTNRKGIKELKTELEDMKNRMKGCEDYESRVDKAIDRLMDRIDNLIK